MSRTRHGTPDGVVAVVTLAALVLAVAAVAGGAAAAGGSGTALAAGDNATDTEGTTGGWIYYADDSDTYRFDPAPNASSASVVLVGPESEDFDLYLTFDGREPTTTDFDARATSAGSNESLTVDVTESDQLGVSVYARSGGGEYDLTVTDLVPSEGPSIDVKAPFVENDTVAASDTPRVWTNGSSQESHEHTTVACTVTGPAELVDGDCSGIAELQFDDDAGGSQVTVEATLTNDWGQTATDTLTLEVEGEGPSVGPITGPDVVDVDEYPGYSVDTSGLGDDAEFTWNASGAAAGVDPAGDEATVWFDQSGTATVTVSVHDGDDYVGSASTDVQVQSRDQEEFSVDASFWDLDESTVEAGDTAIVVANTTAPATYDWSTSGAVERAHTVELLDDHEYVAGQTLTTDRFASVGEVDLLGGAGTFLRDVPVDSDGTLQLDTAELEGSYTLAVDDGASIDFQVLDDDTRTAVRFVEDPTTGTAEITVDATASETNESATDTLTVEVEEDNEPPVAEFTVSPEPTVGESVVLDATGSTDPDGDALNYEWSVGESVSDGPVVNTTFEDPGTVVLGLTVTDEHGASDTDSITVEVESAGPSVDIEVPETLQDGTAQVNQTATLVANATGDDPTYVLTYDWNVSGAAEIVGPTDSGDNVSVRFVDYPPADSAEITVQVSVPGSADSATDTLTVEVDETNRPPRAGFGYDAEFPTAGEGITFNAGSVDPDGDDLEYQWSVDGESAGQRDPFNYTFEEPGEHVVSLTVTDEHGATDTAKRTLDVAPNLIDLDVPESLQDGSVDDGANATLTARALTDASLRYEWADYAGAELVATDGNGAVVTFNRTPTDYVTHHVGAVTVLATDEEGNTDRERVQVDIEPVNDAPTADFSVSPAEPETFETVTFTAVSGDSPGTVVDNGTALDYEWRVDGDTQWRGGDTFRRSFQEAGSYEVTLVVTDEHGATDTATQTLEVAPSDPELDTEVVGPRVVEEGTSHVFGAATTGADGPLEYDWSVTGSGELDGWLFFFVADNERRVEFGDDGAAIVEATVSDGNETTSDNTSVRVRNTPPEYELLRGPGTDEVRAGDIFGVTLAATDYAGDDLGFDVRGAEVVGETFDTESVDATHNKTEVTYRLRATDPGLQTVTFLVTDDDGGTRSVSTSLTVLPPEESRLEADLTAPTTVDEGSTHRLEVDTEGAAGTVAYDWSLDGPAEFASEDVLLGSGDGESKSVEFTGARLVTVSVTVSDDTGTTTASRTVEVEDVEPTVSIRAPGEVDLGEEATVTVTPSDPGQPAGSLDVSLETPDGVRVVSREEQVAATGAIGSEPRRFLEYTLAFDRFGPQELTATVADDDGNTVRTTESVRVDLGIVPIPVPEPPRPVPGPVPVPGPDPGPAPEPVPAPDPPAPTPGPVEPIPMPTPGPIGPTPAPGPAEPGEDCRATTPEDPDCDGEPEVPSGGVESGDATPATR